MVDILRDRVEESFFAAEGTYIRGRIDAKPKDLPLRIFVQAQKRRYFLLTEFEKYPNLKQFYKKTDHESIFFGRDCSGYMLGDLSIHFKIYIEESIRVRLLVKFSHSKPMPADIEQVKLPGNEGGYMMRQVRSLEKLSDFSEFYTVSLNIPRHLRTRKFLSPKIDYVKSNMLSPIQFDKQGLFEKAKLVMKKYNKMKIKANEKKSEIQEEKKKDKFMSLHRKEFSEMLRYDQLDAQTESEKRRLMKIYMLQMIWISKVFDGLRNKMIVAYYYSRKKRSTILR